MLFIEDWRCDQHRWRQYGHKDIPLKNSKVKKYYFSSTTATGARTNFKKTVVYLPDNLDRYLIQYTGDDTDVEDYPHGNAIDSATRNYIRTCPSVLQEIKSSSQAECPSSFYKKKISTSKCHSTLNPVLNPRNVKQVANHKSIERQKFRVSHDELYNIHEMAYDLSGFVGKIITYPDLIIVCGNPKMFDEVESLMHTDFSSPQLLSYDTTFELGDIYASVLVMRHTLFRGAPVIPVCFLLHERKLKSAHEELMKYVATKCPILANPKSKRKIPIVTDEESALCSSIDKWLPGVVRLRCWNHTFAAVRHWLREHKTPSVEKPVYKEDVRCLLQTTSLSDYETGLEEVKVLNMINNCFY